LGNKNRDKDNDSCSQFKVAVAVNFSSFFWHFLFRKQFAQDEELLKGSEAAQHSAISGYLVASSPTECLFIHVDEWFLVTRALRN